MCTNAPSFFGKWVYNKHENYVRKCIYYIPILYGNYINSTEIKTIEFLKLYNDESSSNYNGLF